MQWLRKICDTLNLRSYFCSRDQLVFMQHFDIDAHSKALPSLLVDSATGLTAFTSDYEGARFY